MFQLGDDLLQTYTGTSPAKMAGPAGQAIEAFANAAGIQADGAPPPISQSPTGVGPRLQWDPESLVGYLRLALFGGNVKAFLTSYDPNGMPTSAWMHDPHSRARSVIRLWIVRHPGDQRPQFENFILTR